MGSLGESGAEDKINHNIIERCSSSEELNELLIHS